jgi:hypothetical protein
MQMRIEKSFFIPQWDETIRQRVLDFWSRRNIVFKKITGDTLIGKRGNLWGNLTSFDMSKLMAELSIKVSSENRISCVLEVNPFMQHITDWNKAWWNLEMESFESFLLNGNEQVEKWKHFTAAHQKAASVWSFTFGLRGNEPSPDFTSENSSKEAQNMNKVVLKPTWSKILLSWLVMSLIIYIFIILFNWKEITDFFSLTLVTLVLLFQCFVFSIIFYNLPYFKIEINDRHLVGPRGLGGGWQRIQIPQSL